MPAPPGLTARPTTAQTHAAEVLPAGTTASSRRDVLVQCASCGTAGTARITGQRFASRSVRATDSTTVAYRRWQAATGSPDEKQALYSLRDARRRPVTWSHDDCGGLLRPFDIGQSA